jgi:hypothetical protein
VTAVGRLRFFIRHRFTFRQIQGDLRAAVIGGLDGLRASRGIRFGTAMHRWMRVTE